MCDSDYDEDYYDDYAEQDCFYDEYAEQDCFCDDYADQDCIFEAAHELYHDDCEGGDELEDVIQSGFYEEFESEEPNGNCEDEYEENCFAEGNNESSYEEGNQSYFEDESDEEFSYPHTFDDQYSDYQSSHLGNADSGYGGNRSSQEEPSFFEYFETNNSFHGRNNDKSHQSSTPKKDDPKLLKRKLAESKRTLGNFLYKQKLYESALLQYTEAIHFLPTEAKFYSNRSACFMMLSKYPDAIADARMAIQCDSKFEKAYIRLVNCQILTGDYNSGQETIEQFLDVFPKSCALFKQTQDCKELAALDNLIGVCYAHREYKNVLIYLNKALKIASASDIYKNLKVECESLANVKDYYKILGVSQNATLTDLKAAFRKQAILHHPDKHANLSAELRKKHEEKFKLVKEAFDVLSARI